MGGWHGAVSLTVLGSVKGITHGGVCLWPVSTKCVSDLDEQLLWQLPAGALTTSQPNLAGYRALTGSAADPSQEAERLRMLDTCRVEQERGPEL